MKKSIVFAGAALGGGVLALGALGIHEVKEPNLNSEQIEKDCYKDTLAKQPASAIKPKSNESVVTMAQSKGVGELSEKFQACLEAQHNLSDPPGFIIVFNNKKYTFGF